ncbi:MAG: conjugal transfer pilus assembly protein TraD [Solirubrobacteraceae bacterium]|nr:conjugal transfer pilus assembly protein TraD [Solirubrobacteraceae bacterium]
MTPSHPPGPRRPYWALLALIALLLLPSGTADLVLGGAVAVAAAVSLLRAAGRRHGPAGAGRSNSAVVLGADAAGAPVMLGDRQLSAHGLILGASGAGKSTTLLAILTDHIRRGRPVVAIDMKGSPAFARTLADAAAAAGRDFRVWSPDGPAGWNPLQHGNATELKDKLISTERFTEPHYQRAAERYVQLALQVLHEADPDRSATLDRVVSLMEPQRLATMVRHLPGERAAHVEEYLAGLTPDQVSAVRGLGTRLAIISESHTGAFLRPGEDAVDLPAALEGRQVVLFSLNSSIYGKLSAQLGTLAIQDLVTASGHRLDRTRDAAHLPQALVGIDEFSALGGDNVVSLLARGRESGVSVLLATQELADLDRAGRGLRDQVLGVTAVKIAHRQDVPASAQTIAQMAGTTKIWEPTYQIGRGPFGRYETSRGTRRAVEQFVVHPNEIKSLKTGQAVIITKVPGAQVRTVRVAPPARREGPELG